MVQVNRKGHFIVRYMLKRALLVLARQGDFQNYINYMIYISMYHCLFNCVK
jgi:hypothetical protein